MGGVGGIFVLFLLLFCWVFYFILFVLSNRDISHIVKVKRTLSTIIQSLI